MIVKIMEATIEEKLIRSIMNNFKEIELEQHCICHFNVSTFLQINNLATIFLNLYLKPLKFLDELLDGEELEEVL